jgi:hypothetical protein
MRTHAIRAALAVLCLTLAPTASLAQTRGTSRSLVGDWQLGAGIGLGIPFESGVNAGFKLNLDGFYGLTQLTPGVLLQLGGNFGWTHNGGDFNTSFNFFDFLPTARFRFATSSPQLFFYGDAGMGLGIVSASVTLPPALGGGTASDSSGAFLLKFGGGVGYGVTPELSVTFEPAFNIYIKSGSVTQFTLLAGVLYRL